MKYRNYIFDLGNVLVRFDPAAMTAAVVKDPVVAAQITPVVFDRLYWDPLDFGGITDEALKAACHTRLPEDLHNTADEVYDRWMENLTVIPGMQQILTDIRQQSGRLFLLSNVSIGFAQRYQQVPHLAQLLSPFEGLVFSGPLGIVKPDIAIFRHLLETYGLEAEQCVFIDDSAKNISGAASAGIDGYVFDSDASKLRSFLQLEG